MSKTKVIVVFAVVIISAFVYLESLYEPKCKEAGYQKWVPFQCKGVRNGN